MRGRTSGRAIVHEEVHNAKEGEKVYFQRVEIVDDNTCPYCRRMEGKIAVWSDVPLANEKGNMPLGGAYIADVRSSCLRTCPLPGEGFRCERGQDVRLKRAFFLRSR